MMLGDLCSIIELFDMFESQPYLVGHVTCTETNTKAQTAQSSVLIENSANTLYLTIIKMQNVTCQFLELRIILEVMMS